jgi:hypothetical protein
MDKEKKYGVGFVTGAEAVSSRFHDSLIPWLESKVVGIVSGQAVILVVSGTSQAWLRGTLKWNRLI